MTKGTLRVGATVCLASSLTLLLYRLFIRVMDPVDRFARVVALAVLSLLSIVVAIEVVRGIASRVSTTDDIRVRIGKVISFVGFYVLGGLISLVVTTLFIEMADAPLIGQGNNVIYHQFVETLAVVVFIMLAYKVSSVAMLDNQKQCIVHMGRVINGERVAASHITVTDARVDNETYHRLLTGACEGALMAASLTGQQERRSLNGLVAVLFLPDQSTNKFKSVCVAGGTTSYHHVIDSLNPAFFDSPRFIRSYNETHDRLLATPNITKAKIQRELDAFRRTTKEYSSTTGLVYALEKRLMFRDLENKCMTFDFDYIESIPEADRDLFRFKDLVGLPVGVLGRKLGVLLLLSSRGPFYRRDKIYWSIMDLIGMAMHIGIMNGYFERRGFAGCFEQAPYFKSESELKEIVHLANSVRRDFSRPYQMMTTSEMADIGVRS